MEHTLQEDLIGKYLSGELSSGEKASLMAWVDANPQNRAVFEEMIQLWSLTDQAEEPVFPVNIPQAWAVLDTRLMEETPRVVTFTPPADPVLSPPKPLRTAWSARWAWSAAASIGLLLLGLWWVFLRDTKPETFAFQTADNEQRTLTLPDQSKVVLNENSSLSYTFDRQLRSVELSGEAFFDVVKDPQHPFVIHSGEVETKVIGTSFNIRAYPDEKQIKVSVKSGRVEVRKANATPNARAEALVLLPGNTGVYTAGSAELNQAEAIAPVDVDAWQQGTVVLSNGATLGEIIPIVEKLYDIHIEADPEVLNRTLTSGPRLSREEQIQDVLSLLTLPINCAFKQDGDTYIIMQRGM